MLMARSRPRCGLGYDPSPDDGDPSPDDPSPARAQAGASSGPHSPKTATSSPMMEPMDSGTSSCSSSTISSDSDTEAPGIADPKGVPAAALPCPSNRGSVLRWVPCDALLFFLRAVARPALPEGRAEPCPPAGGPAARLRSRGGRWPSCSRRRSHSTASR